MSKVRVHCFSISLDGFGAGPEQSQANPQGINGLSNHEWVFGTRAFNQMIGADGGVEGIDNDFVKQGFDNVGAWIIGRNMFAPSRGAWTDDGWKGWWGENPPYHTDVFILTHHPRESLAMEGGTTFHFVTGGIHVALERAKEAAGGGDVRVGGGASTIRQYLRASLIDEMHLAITPALLGSGEHLLTGIDLPALGYRRTHYVTTPGAMHVTITRK